MSGVTVTVPSELVEAYKNAADEPSEVYSSAASNVRRLVCFVGSRNVFSTMHPNGSHKEPADEQGE